MAVLRDIAIIIIAVEMFVFALVPITLVGALVYGAWLLRKHENLPSWLKLAQAYLALGLGYVQLAMAIIVRPILMINSAVATVRGWVAGIAKAGGDKE
jgi:hypothetical protein